ncbi:MAG: TonB-dependent receptor plug domain-containing protein, partial [Candidatus Binataceae bacterium]
MLKIGTEKTSVTVTSAGDLVATDSSTHTDLDRLMIDKLPLEGSTSSLSSLVTLSTPGISADSNGLFHGLGDHASNSFSLDGQPITDQQSKVFSNQLPVDAVQSMEVIEGAPPAEYGGKTSVVMVVTTRSGLGVTEPHGDVTASYGSFGTSSGGFDLVDGGKMWGNFISISGTDTGRFLDGPELTVMHDHGNEENVFDRVDLKLSAKDSINFNLGVTRSWFQVPNSFDAQNATAWNGLTVNNGGLGPNGQPVGSEDQRAKIQSLNIAPAWTRLMGSNVVFTFGGYLRRDQFNYYPSRDPFADYTPDLQLQTVGQNRTLTNAGGRTNVSYVKGIHNLKAGITYQHTFITEKDALGVVDPALNAPCLLANGSPDTSPSLTNPAGCTGSLQPNPAFVPILGCYDLTRTATLPASDGCPSSTSGLYNFYGHADIKELALYIQDTL